MAVMYGLIYPTMMLIDFKNKLQKLKANILCRRVFKGNHAETADGSVLQASQEEQHHIATTVSRLLIILSFGILVPQLLVLGPLGLWLNMFAAQWKEAHAHSRPFGEQLALRILVQVPFDILRKLSYVLNLLVAIFIFLDLEFNVIPISSYGMLLLSEILTRLWFRHRRTSHSVRHKTVIWKVTPNVLRVDHEHGSGCLKADLINQMDSSRGMSGEITTMGSMNTQPVFAHKDSEIVRI